ncbi:hypothetical protein V6U89_04995 [Micromonospora sp. CPCC 206171]|uniref:hypothetical protein n=1 Tax=Micromonospora sp. CPCC 206171 TaxID=3122405 RepID=UPI002FF0CE78
MPEQEVLATEFARYRQAVMAEIEVPGPAAVRRAVHRRRRNHLAAGATAALTLVAGPVVGYAALDRSAPHPTPVDPTPSATASPSPTPSGSGSPSPSSATTSTSPTGAPDGRISRAQLLAGPVTLPTWHVDAGCPNGRVRLTGEAGWETNTLLALDTGDIDGDGAAETVALVQCVRGTGGPQQVVAFDRDRSGRIVTVGQVTRTRRERPQWLSALDVRDDGVVRVQVGDIAPGGGWPGDWSQRQWRGYRWDGRSFGQVSGPTAFAPNPHEANLVLTATDLVLATAPDGSRTGTVTVRIRNAGTGPAAFVALRLGLPSALRPDGDGWAPCRNTPATTSQPVGCDLGRLDAGAEFRLTLGLRAAAGVTVGRGTADVDARPMDARSTVVEEVYEADNVVRIDYR